MGCDVHICWEQKRGDVWEPLWPIRLDRDYVSDVFWDQIENGNIAMVMPPNENEPPLDPSLDDSERRRILAERIATYLEAKPHEKIVEEYPNLDWDFMTPFPTWQDQYPPRSRNYGYFGLLHRGVRTDPADGFKGRGFPDDACFYTHHNYWRWGGDGTKGPTDAHSPSWLMVREVLEHPRANEFSQVAWMREHIKDPSTTRMVFWFDN